MDMPFELYNLENFQENQLILVPIDYHHKIKYKNFTVNLE